MRPLLALSFLAASSFGAAQDLAPPVPSHRFPVPPTIDGTIDEAGEWKDAPKFSGLYDEETSAVAPDQGEFWLAYDSDFIYFAARLADSRPDTISATEYRTNVGMSGDDHIGFVLDPSGSLNDFSTFKMNSRGATSVSISGGTAAKREWSGEFISQGRKTATGWEVEARIPWQILRLPAAGTRDIRFNVFRYMPRTQKDYIHRPTIGGRSDNAGRWTAVEIPKQERIRTLKLLPYGYLGSADGEPLIFNTGLDLKTPISDRIELVGTVNPDFRNVENQILSLDFSRFERLAGETRPFFQEGSGYISNALFASQRIRELDAGINIFGKLSDRLSFGVLDTARFADEEENAFVSSAAYQLDPNSNARVSLTSLRQQVGDIENDGYLIRYSRSFGPVNLFLRNMGTDDKQVGKGDAKSINLQYGLNGLEVFAGYDQISPDFTPRLGFTPETDYKGYYYGFENTKTLGSGPLLDYGFQVFASKYDHFDGSDYKSDVSEVSRWDSAMGSVSAPPGSMRSSRA